MALYSWFSQDNKKSKNVRANSDLLKKSDTVSYIENYTMWPTAKIKLDVEITPPNYVDKSLQPQEAVLPAEITKLTPIKS